MDSTMRVQNMSLVPMFVPEDKHKGSGNVWPRYQRHSEAKGIRFFKCVVQRGKTQQNEASSASGVDESNFVLQVQDDDSIPCSTAGSLPFAVERDDLDHAQHEAVPQTCTVSRDPVFLRLRRLGYRW